MRADHIVEILRVANDLRHTDPVSSINILRNLHALVAALPGEAVAAEPMGQEGPDEEKDKKFREDITRAIKQQLTKFEREKQGLKLDDKAVEEWMSGLDAILGGKQASLLSDTHLKVLIHVAHANPGIRNALLPIIVAASKKKPKKTSKPSKTSKPVRKPMKGGKGKKKEKEEACDKPVKNQPVSKKKKTTKKRRKASFVISSDDAKW